jgi:hypothetical protein
MPENGQAGLVDAVGSGIALEGEERRRMNQDNAEANPGRESGVSRLRGRVRNPISLVGLVLAGVAFATPEAAASDHALSLTYLRDVRHKSE